MSFIEKAIESSKEYFESRYSCDIERNRKGDFSVKVTKNGEPINNAEISYRLKKIDFDFGCNIFMLGQYDDKEQERLYLEQWKNLFNTAVVPLYWEGTEPEKDYLRYEKDSPNDVYRRPPVDTVVEYCKNNDLKLKGHPLFWQEFIPKWLPENWDELYPLIEKRFKEISERYAEDIPVFDCVNEPSRLWDQQYEYKNTDWKCVFPPEGYLEQIFALGEKYFPNNELILNEATGSAICEFRGVYGAHYQLLKRLLKQGLKIDRIGLQCHLLDSPSYKNLFNAERFYGVLDTYGKLGKPLVLSEVSLSCADEEIQAAAVEQIYKICFSHESMSGVIWWNLDDNGILCEKQRNADGENLPHGGLVRNGTPKASYKVLDRLINHEWTTNGKANLLNGKAEFNGFYGEYEITVNGKTFNVNLSKNSDRNVVIEV